MSGTVLRRRSRHWAIGVSGGLLRVPWHPPLHYPSGSLTWTWLGPLARVYGIDREYTDPYLQLGFIGSRVASSPDTDCGNPLLFGPQVGLGNDWYFADWAGIGLFASYSIALPMLGVSCSSDSNGSVERPSSAPVIFGTWMAGGSILFGAGK